MAYATLKILHGMPSESLRAPHRQVLWLIAPDFPRAFILSPVTSIQPPLSSELSARFPDWPVQDLQALMQDHEDEIRVLNGYITEAGLEERVLEVIELVRSDEAQADGDVDVHM